MEDFVNAVKRYIQFRLLQQFMDMVDSGITVGWGTITPPFPPPPGMSDLNHTREEFEAVGTNMTTQQHQTYAAACQTWVNENPDT